MPATPAVLLLTLAAMTWVAASSSGGSASHQGDGTACYKGCSGHGHCVQYMCKCDVGYHGEDCGTSFLPGGGGSGGGGGAGGGPAPVALPILSAGHVNVTRGSHRALVAATKRVPAGSPKGVLVLGYSDPDCARCVAFEPEYATLAGALKGIGVRPLCGLFRLDCVCLVDLFCSRSASGCTLASFFFCFLF
jgi:hypothetical protein